MSDRAWYRSLYWRIAIGFVLFLGIMLAIQVTLVLWLAARASDTVPGRSPDDLAALVASDLSATLAAQPDTDPGGYLREHYGQLSRPVLYFPANGQAVASRPFEIPPQIAEMAQRRLQRGGPGPGFGPGLGRGGGPGRGSRPGADPPLFRGVRGQAALAPVIVDGQRAGLVVVPPFGPRA
jgi:hypothetical protein